MAWELHNNHISNRNNQAKIRRMTQAAEECSRKAKSCQFKFQTNNTNTNCSFNNNKWPSSSKRSSRTSITSSCRRSSNTSSSCWQSNSNSSNRSKPKRKTCKSSIRSRFRNHRRMARQTVDIREESRAPRIQIKRLQITETRQTLKIREVSAQSYAKCHRDRWIQIHSHRQMRRLLLRTIETRTRNGWLDHRLRDM